MGKESNSNRDLQFAEQKGSSVQEGKLRVLSLKKRMSTFFSCFAGGTAVKNLPANAGDGRDTGSIPGSGRSLGGGHGNPLQYSCLENPMDRGTCWATVHRVAKSQTRLK